MLKSIVVNQVTALASAISFLSRVPVDPLLRRWKGASVGPDGRYQLGMAYFPLVGGAIGLASGLLYVCLDFLALPVPFCAIAAVIGSIVLTGALHEDGLADFADGLGGGHSREQRLEIMKDSRVGTFGVLALISCLGLRWSAIAALASSEGAGAVVGALTAAHAISRAPLPLILALSVPATAGLAGGASRPRAGEIVVAMALAVAIGTIAAPIAPVAIGIVVTGYFTWALAAMARHYLGGHTGDVLGAIQQAGEVAMLAAIVSWS